MKEIFYARQELAEQKVVEQSEEYRELLDRSLELRKELKRVLGESDRKLLSKFDEVQTDISILFLESSYMQGLKDGFKLKEIIES